MVIIRMPCHFLGPALLVAYLMCTFSRAIYTDIHFPFAANPQLRSLAKKFRLKCKEYEVELAALEVAAPELEDMQKELDSLDKAQSKVRLDI